MFKYGGGQWDFRFCGFGYFLDRFSIFVPKDLGFSILVFITVCRFSFFSIWFSVFAKNTNGF